MPMGDIIKGSLFKENFQGPVFLQPPTEGVMMDSGKKGNVLDTVSLYLLAVIGTKDFGAIIN